MRQYADTWPYCLQCGWRDYREAPSAPALRQTHNVFYIRYGGEMPALRDLVAIVCIAGPANGQHALQYQVQCPWDHQPMQWRRHRDTRYRGGIQVRRYRCPDGHWIDLHLVQEGLVWT